MDEPGKRTSLWVATSDLPEYPPLEGDAVADVLVVGGGMTGLQTAYLLKQAGLTVILIEHEMSVIERVTDRCVVLNYGEKICEGTYAEVAADPQVRQAYLGVA